jgi:hypothetical protein
MKYFTPSRYLRLQNMAEPDTVLAALNEWDQAVKQYRADLAPILPPGEKYEDLRSFALHVSLHDGVVLASWFARGRLYLVVRPEPPATRLVSLTYSLAGEPVVVDHAFPDHVRTDTMEWMYDEIARLPLGSTPPDEAVFTHNILLGNGCELCIPFTRMKVGRPSMWLQGVPTPAGQPRLATPTS